MNDTDNIFHFFYDLYKTLYLSFLLCFYFNILCLQVYRRVSLHCIWCCMYMGTLTWNSIFVLCFLFINLYADDFLEHRFKNCIGFSCVLGGSYMASDKSQITNNKSCTLERTRCDILRNPFEESDS